MPGEQAEYDLIRVLDDQADSKQDTFFISPKEIGRAGSGLQTLTVESVEEPDAPASDQFALFLDDTQTLTLKAADGTTQSIQSETGFAGAIHERVIESGESVTVDSDESLVLTGPVTIDGTLTVNGGVTFL
jgi:phage baseplate assembly protein gpV